MEIALIARRSIFIVSLDVMLVIHSDRVDFYCHPLILRHFLPYIASWKNLHIHCLRETEVSSKSVQFYSCNVATLTFSLWICICA